MIYKQCGNCRNNPLLATEGEDAKNYSRNPTETDQCFIAFRGLANCSWFVF